MLLLDGFQRQGSLTIGLMRQGWPEPLRWWGSDRRWLSWLFLILGAAAAERPIEAHAHFGVRHRPASAIRIHEDYPEQSGFWSIVDDEMCPAAALDGVER